MIRVLGFALYGPQAASHRYRLAQFAPGLAQQGIDLHVVSLLSDAYLRKKFANQPISRADVLSDYLERLRSLSQLHRWDMSIVYGEWMPFLPGWLEAACMRRPFIYDMDDAFYLKYKHHSNPLVRAALANKFERVMGKAAAITAGNATLLRQGSRINTNTHFLPTVVDTSRYLPEPARRAVHPQRPLTIGWVGSPSTAPYLEQVAAPLEALAQEGPVRLVVMGGAAPKLRGVQVLEQPWVEADEVDAINGFDVGIMPLPDDEWARGKCAFKLIQYMACGVPVVASPVGANVDVVSPETGFLASTDHAWLQALRRLRDDAALRERMGQTGRERIVSHYSLQTALPVLAGVIRQVHALNSK